MAFLLCSISTSPKFKSLPLSFSQNCFLQLQVWQMPQGGVDEGEDPRSAAIRELREETRVNSAEVIVEGYLFFSSRRKPPKVGVEKLSKEDVQKMQWEVLEAKIGNWIHFMHIAGRTCLEFEQIWQFSCSEYMVMHEQVKLLYAGEWIVCDQIFEGFDSLRDQCFGEVTASSVSVLLSFGDAIAKSKRSPEKLFVLLEMFEIMRELHSEVEKIFKGKACSEIRDSTFGLRKWLAQTTQETFGNFEEAVEKDATKTAVLDGTVHPLTSYVIPIVPFFVGGLLVESGKNPQKSQKYIKYGAEDFERMLGEFFEGKNLNVLAYNSDK